VASDDPLAESRGYFAAKWGEDLLLPSTLHLEPTNSRSLAQKTGFGMTIIYFIRANSCVHLLLLLFLFPAVMNRELVSRIWWEEFGAFPQAFA
jgi:hypothetical protein